MVDGSVNDADSLGACRTEDAKGRVAAACGKRLRAKLDKRCANLDTDVLFPGCVCQAPDQCIGVAARNLANMALELTDNLGSAPLHLPIARRLQSDVGMPWIVSAGELASYVGKLEAYAASTGAWRDRALLLADNPDSAGDFSTQSDDVAAILGSYDQELVYLSEMTPAEARAALQSAWNKGAQLVNYIGHAAVFQLAAENLLGVNDMGALSNGAQLPIVSALTCVVGRSDVPNFESLAEALVTDADGGAIAVWAPSGLSISSAAHNLNTLYATAVESAAPDTPLGRIVLDTLVAFSASIGSEAMLDAYSIVGDPAVILP